eukprot:scaffold25012_cov58-Phaeocystis_antarctica.AAC.1
MEIVGRWWSLEFSLTVSDRDCRGPSPGGRRSPRATLPRRSLRVELPRSRSPHCSSRCGSWAV